MQMKIAIGNDHAGFELKLKLQAFLAELGFEIVNHGSDTGDSVDYPDFVWPVVESVESKTVNFGILICGTGQGVGMTANKDKNIRAAVCWNKEIASLARRHNDANVLCLPAHYLTEREMNSIVLNFLNTRFDGGRHFNRIVKMTSVIK